MKHISLSAKAAVVMIAALIGTLIVVSPAQAATRSCTNSTPVASRPTLAYGDTGSCVVVAQTLLLKKGYSLGGYSATGNYLTYTKAAVVRFQQNNKLTQTGTVNASTWSKLAAASSAPKPPTSGPTPTTYSIYRGPNYTKRVVLTYDDCPKSLAAMKSMVLAAQRSNVGLVLAPTGNCITSGKFDAAYARSHGQYVINHSISHPNLTTLSYAGVQKQLGAPGVVTNYGRAPFGAYNTTVKNAYASKGMRLWLWNVDTNDWTGKSSSSVISYVKANSFAGSTVLMHMQWNGFTPSALASMKSGLAARGLSVCRAYPGTSPVKLPSSLPC
jgi:peptidoglycan hydrolase-like protein with peptidoglycan-binding domain